MFDVALAETIANALTRALANSLRGDDPNVDAVALGLSDRQAVSRVCRRAAINLLCEMTGGEMLDLALAKLASESELRMATAPRSADDASRNGEEERQIASS